MLNIQRIWCFIIQYFAGVEIRKYESLAKEMHWTFTERFLIFSLPVSYKSLHESFLFICMKENCKPHKLLVRFCFLLELMLLESLRFVRFVLVYLVDSMFLNDNFWGICFLYLFDLHWISLVMAEGLEKIYIRNGHRGHVSHVTQSSIEQIKHFY